MLDEVVRQVRRLFSSKTNASKLVRQPIDRLHYLKQLVFGLSLLLLLGYGQFRKHFECRGAGGVSDKFLSNFCYINGTTTTIWGAADEGEHFRPAAANQTDQQQQQQSQPHVGLQFRGAHGARQVVINHNYMRSLWALLLLMAICSFLAQRNWAALFHHRLLRALLRLPGHQELELVRWADKSQPYRRLVQQQQQQQQRQQPPPAEAAAKEPPPSEGQTELAAAAAGGEAATDNQHNHQLDYYPNQLLYLLLVQPASAYRLAQLRLGRRLVRHSLASFALTCAQFLLAREFIGPKFTLYGWHYLLAWLHYELQQLRRPNAEVNTVDYHLSARIWPTSTQCEFKQFGFEEPVSVVVQCTVAINEICGKLFAVIWWLLAANLLVELHHLALTLASAWGSPQLAAWLLGRRCWPQRRREALNLATFRHRRALILGPQVAGGSPLELADELEANNKHDNQDNIRSSSERKRREAEGSRESVRLKSWYLWCPRDVFLSLAHRLRNLWRGSGGAHTKLQRMEQERAVDTDLYHLLRLLHLRLGGSSRKLEQIIKMTSDALDTHLAGLRQARLAANCGLAARARPLEDNKANGADLAMANPHHH